MAVGGSEVKIWITSYEDEPAFCLGIVFAFNEKPKVLAVALGFFVLNFSFGK